MLPLLRLWLARKLCPPTHRVEAVDPGSFVEAVCRRASTAERDRASAAAAQATPGIESWNGRAR